jgi:predicted amidohydrolase
MEHVDGDKSANLAKIEAFVLKARKRDVEMIVFPECAITGYWFLRKLDRGRLTALAEPVPDGPSSQCLLKLASANQMTLGAGLVERDKDGTLYNTYIVAMPNGELKFHRKIHCFISEHLASGDQFTVFPTPHDCTVGLLTCYDNNIFENTRMTALAGAEILLAPHQTGGCFSPSPHCMGLVDPHLWVNRHNDSAAIEAEFHGPKGRQWHVPDFQQRRRQR